MFSKVDNWARFPHSSSILFQVDSPDGEMPFQQFNGSFLPYGMGRSLGDCCLNDGNALLTTRGLNRILSFDPETGRLIAEAGITFDKIMCVTIPQGWFLPVTPGTRFVSLGGAVANDVHGKNHHCAGTFGNHVIQMELIRSDGTRIRCSQFQNGGWFRATLGGLGLTGLIAWVEVQLKPLVNSWIDAEMIRMRSLAEFYQLSEESVGGYEHVVAWVDTLNRKQPGRGLFMRGNHNADPALRERVAPTGPHVTVPFILPFQVLNRRTITAFNNTLYASRPRRQRKMTPLGTFFYPLDGIGAYHRIYGPGGMIQWQGLIPVREAVSEVLAASAYVGGSLLTVMKVMGNRTPPGLMSFSGPGVTIALDFPYSREVIERLPRLDEIVAAAGGRLYPAKDARMSGVHFRQFYPQWEEMAPFIDHRFSSSFWRRVMADQKPA